jgi:hypothetical protein
MSSERSVAPGQVMATCLAAALGAAFGNLAYIAALRSLAEPSQSWLQWVVIAPVMYLASRSFFDPLSAAIRSFMGLPPSPPSASPRGRGLWALAAGSVVFGIWLADALQKYTEANPLLVVLAILTSIVLVGGITLGWIAGAGSAWPVSWLYGGLAGLVVNGIATYILLSLQAPAVDSASLAAASAASGASVALVGAAGGLAIDVGAGRRPSVQAPAIATLAFVLTGAAGIWLFASTTIDGVAPNVALGLGWLLGLASSQDADAALRRHPPA